MKHYIKIRLNTLNKTSILIKLNALGVDIRNIVYQKEALVFECLATDLKRLKKYLSSYNFEIIDDTGFYKIKTELKKNFLIIIGIIFSVIMFLFLTNIIVKVNIIHQDKNIRELLETALKEEGVTALSLKKSYQEYEEIIIRIKEQYKDKIEWLEIDVQGMVINIRVEERIINNYQTNTNFCHIVAQKSGIIRSILTKKGVALVTVNNYVQAGDLLISGQIKLNEEVKNNVCADGEVIAEVWYNAKISFPLNHEEVNRTGKMRYNFIVNDGLEDHLLLKSRVQDKEQEKKLIFQAFGYKFYLVKEYEVTREVKTYNEEEALKKAQEAIIEKVNVKGNQSEAIISQKVLQKEIKNGNLDIEMFLSVLEQIGEAKNYIVTDEETDGDSLD